MRLAELRLAKGWTQEQLAKRVGSSVRSVKSWEAGRVPHPVFRRALTRVLGQEPDFSAIDAALADPEFVASLDEMAQQLQRGELVLHSDDEARAIIDRHDHGGGAD